VQSRGRRNATPWWKNERSFFHRAVLLCGAATRYALGGVQHHPARPRAQGSAGHRSAKGCASERSFELTEAERTFLDFLAAAASQLVFQDPLREGRALDGKKGRR
jgi:hypothetical protein